MIYNKTLLIKGFDAEDIEDWVADWHEDMDADKMLLHYTYNPTTFVVEVAASVSSAEFYSIFEDLSFCIEPSNSSMSLTGWMPTDDTCYGLPENDIIMLACVVDKEDRELLDTLYVDSAGNCYLCNDYIDEALLTAEDHKIMDAHSDDDFVYVKPTTEYKAKYMPLLSSLPRFAPNKPAQKNKGRGANEQQGRNQNNYRYSNQSNNREHLSPSQYMFNDLFKEDDPFNYTFFAKIVLRYNYLLAVIPNYVEKHFSSPVLRHFIVRIFIEFACIMLTIFVVLYLLSKGFDTLDATVLPFDDDMHMLVVVVVGGAIVTYFDKLVFVESIGLLKKIGYYVMLYIFNVLMVGVLYPMLFYIVLCPNTYTGRGETKSVQGTIVDSYYSSSKNGGHYEFKFVSPLTPFEMRRKVGDDSSFMHRKDCIVYYHTGMYGLNVVDDVK